jgi:hypothetical protein
VARHDRARSVIHCSALQGAVRIGESARLDDVDGNAQTGAKAEDRAYISRLVGLEQGNAHAGPIAPVAGRSKWQLANDPSPGYQARASRRDVAPARRCVTVRIGP